VAREKIYLEPALLKSSAFRLLGGTAKNVYFDFLMKCRVKGMKVRGNPKKEYVILNDGKIEYCYSEAERNGINRASFRNALDDLMENGLIDISHSGSGGAKGDKSLYAISDRWRKYGTPDFVPVVRPRDTRQGRGFQQGNTEWQKRQSANMGVKTITGGVKKPSLHNANYDPEKARWSVKSITPKKAQKR
jgi:hypothetical protein